jgi:uncharacterized membrane protein
MILFLLILPVLLMLDLFWLGVVMKDFYARELGELARRNGGSFAPRWGAAIAVYLLIPAGLVLFVRPQLTPQTSPFLVFGLGAMFGLVLYGVYDLTNLAILDRWTVSITVADIAWGCVLCGTVAAIMNTVESRLAR